MAIIAHYRAHPGAWKPGLLHWRVRNATPSSSPADGWPLPDKAYARRRHDDELREQRRIEQAALKERAARDAATTAEREARYGPLVDALTPDERHKLLPPIMRKLSDGSH